MYFYGYQKSREMKIAKLVAWNKEKNREKNNREMFFFLDFTESHGFHKKPWNENSKIRCTKKSRNCHFHEKVKKSEKNHEIFIRFHGIFSV